jgi:hypothetical protein
VVFTCCTYIIPTTSHSPPVTAQELHIEEVPEKEYSAKIDEDKITDIARTNGIDPMNFNYEKWLAE